MGERGEGQQGGMMSGPSDDDNNCAGRLKSEFRVKNFGLSHPKPGRFVSSEWGFPKLYLAWRVLWAVYHVGWIVYIWTDDAIHTDRLGTWLIYLTNWGYFLLSCDTVIRAIVQIYVTIANRQFEDGEVTWYLKGVWLVYTIASDAALLITVLYYALLFTGTWLFISAVTHLVNSVYVILDLAVTAMPVRLFHVLHFVIFALLYLIFSVVYWGAGGLNGSGEEYIYKPLNWADPGKAVPLAVGVVLAAVPLTHLVLWSLHMLRVCVRNLTGKGKIGSPEVIKMSDVEQGKAGSGSNGEQ